MVAEPTAAEVPGTPGRFDVLYICYWSLMDPLCQTQSLAYLKRLAAGGRRFALITFEQSRYRLSMDRADEMTRALASLGIHWHPLTYHKRYPLLGTGFDCLCGVLLGVFLCWRHRIRVVHSRASIPAAIALAIKAVCRVKFLYDADSRLSEEYADNGHWARGGAAFRLVAWVEDRARRTADAVVVLSDQLRQDFVREFRVRAPIEVIPCCVDADRFRFDSAARERRRRELDIGRTVLFVYVGKLGPRYLVAELFEMFRAAREHLGSAHLLILSGDAPEDFEAVAAARGVERGAFTIVRSPHPDVPGWLSAADVGMALIRPAGCEREFADQSCRVPRDRTAGGPHRRDRGLQ